LNLLNERWPVVLRTFAMQPFKSAHLEDTAGGRCSMLIENGLGKIPGFPTFLVRETVRLVQYEKHVMDLLRYFLDELQLGA
jgi:hypothetical protein